MKQPSFEESTDFFASQMYLAFFDIMIYAAVFVQDFFVGKKFGTLVTTQPLLCKGRVVMLIGMLVKFGFG